MRPEGEPATLAAGFERWLPSLDDACRAAIARALLRHARQLVADHWEQLVERCAAALAAGPAAILRVVCRERPDPELLLPVLGGLITPAALFGLEVPDPHALRVTLLCHPDPIGREEALDALCNPGGDDTFERACQDWSRHMLLSALGRIAGLSHADRLRLQEDVLGEERRIQPSKPLISLRQALLQADERICVTILSARAGTPVIVAEVAMRKRDCATLLALCWKAGCTPAETMAVQVVMGRLRPDQALRMGSDGSWPMDQAAMQWRIAAAISPADAHT